MPVRLIDSLATTEPLAEVFSDRSVLQAMLEFEVALARVEARLKIIPQAAAEVIATVADSRSIRHRCSVSRHIARGNTRYSFGKGTH